MKKIILLLANFVVLSYAQCYLNSLSQYPCTPRTGVTVPMPGFNEYGVYSTRIRPGIDGSLTCILRRRGHIVRNIENLSTPDTKLIFSPGYEREPKQKYPNQMIAHYNISCGESTSAFLTISFLDMETKNCFVPASEQIECQDYIQITGKSGVKKFCGDKGINILLNDGSFHLTLRTSDRNRFKGFAGYVVCFKNSQRIGECARVKPNDISASKSRLEKVSSLSYRQNQESESLLNIAALEKTDSRAPSFVAPPTMTVAEKTALDMVVSPFIDDRLRTAREQTPIWPPPEFEDDIEDSVTTLLPIPDHFLLPIKEKPVPIPTLPGDNQLASRDTFSQHKRAAVDLLANRVALAYQDACNPILRSATKSFVTYANKVAPVQLSSAKNQLMRDQELLPNF